MDTKVKDLPSIPVEPSITREEPYNLIIQLNLTSTKALSIDRTIAAMLVDQFAGLGKVDLFKMELRFMATAGGQKVSCALVGGNTNVSMETAMMGMFGKAHVSTNYNYGVQSVWEFDVPDLYTAQIQPASSLAPPFRVMYSAAAGVSASMIFFLKFHGPMIKRVEYEGK